MILVAGGTGTLGRALLPLLAGRPLRVLTRQGSSPLPEGVEPVIGDVRAPGHAVAGCDTVISAVHGFLGPSPEAIDRDGNRALIRAAVAAGVKQFILVSGQGVSADHPMSLHRAKFAAETSLRSSGLGFTIIRPTAFLETWMMVIGQSLEKKGLALVFGPGRNPINFVSVRDVAALIALAVRDPTLRGETLEIGGEDLDFSTIAEALIRAHGRAARVKRIPLWALRAMAILARPFAPAFARQAQAAVIMNTRDFRFANDVRARFPSLPSTRLQDLL